MSDVVCGLSETPLDVPAALARVRRDAAGAIASFVGTVRSTGAAPDVTDVVALEYEAHPLLAEERLASAAREAAHRWGLLAVEVVHRTGRCELGDPTVVVVCSAPHRRAALEACSWLIDEIKTTVPIWKKEITARGESWVGTNLTHPGAPPA
ncbi:MAG: molybdenum cofactor biosynthesis protein MoaE [Actinomycetota bacterium]|nr:molybdenum cofactor biosynthesis protein MoaE [Actinomycetota bacterium]